MQHLFRFKDGSIWGRTTMGARATHDTQTQLVAIDVLVMQDLPNHLLAKSKDFAGHGVLRE